MLYLILIFTIPEDKPDDGYDKTTESEPIAHSAQLKGLLGNEKERSADIYLRNLSYFAAPLFLFNLSHKSLILTTGKKGHQA